MSYPTHPPLPAKETASVVGKVLVSRTYFDGMEAHHISILRDPEVFNDYARLSHEMYFWTVFVSSIEIEGD